jgi:hypothetical protein
MLAFSFVPPRSFEAELCFCAPTKWRDVRQLRAVAASYCCDSMRAASDLSTIQKSVLERNFGRVCDRDPLIQVLATSACMLGSRRLMGNARKFINRAKQTG